MDETDIPDAIKAAGNAVKGGRPGSHRWEVITALFGWTAAFALVGWLLAAAFGAGDVSKWLFGIFSAAFGVAFKRDLVKLLLTGKMTE